MNGLAMGKGARSVAASHAGAKIGELLQALGRAGVVRLQAPMLRGVTKSQRDLEVIQRPHLPVKPGVSIGPKTVRPTQPRAEVLDSKFSQPSNSVIQPMILKMEPL